MNVVDQVRELDLGADDIQRLSKEGKETGSAVGFPSGKLWA